MTLNVLNVQNANVTVEAGRGQREIIRFQITLSQPSDIETTVKYTTLAGTAVDGFTGSDKRDYKPITGTVTFAPGETSKEIAVTVFGDRPVNLRTDKNFEIFARDIAYRNWGVGEDVDQINGNSPYGDLGYRVDTFFNDTTTGFQAVGLTSDEKFFLLISDPTNAEIVTESQAEKTRLLKELETAFGGKNSSAYRQAEAVIDGLEDTAWTFATGTIYDQGKAPILAVRGTDSSQDIQDNFNPFGIGFAQFSNNQAALTAWLQKISQPSDANVSFKPHITGASLGGALTQWVASAYSSVGKLGDIVTFNAPGISRAGADSFNFEQVERVTHYISAIDVVSLSGEKFIAGEYILSDYLSGPNINFEHLHPVIIPEIAGSGLFKPESLSQSSPLSVDQLNDPRFTYLPDPDYFVFLLIVANNVSPVSAEQLKFRGTVESLRQNPLTIPQLIAINNVNYGVEFAKENIQAAYSAAQHWSDAAWDAIKNWKADAWAVASKWTPEIWQTTTYWTPEIWQGTILLGATTRTTDILLGNTNDYPLVGELSNYTTDSLVSSSVSDQFTYADNGDSNVIVLAPQQNDLVIVQGSFNNNFQVGTDTNAIVAQNIVVNGGNMFLETGNIILNTEMSYT
ncbi:Calx-beta domain-containing protein [Fortiea contorta]|uniref:Calx-beta domain-containing protein n=1 Tax=Fortiea contorta TaxID=1892405 RepID=UPI00034D3C6D|nr:Calx-beta domain-containing protein [Fortiea contorta]